MSLLPNEVQQYTAIIDDILASSNLETIGLKRVRKQLHARVPELDIVGKKVAIEELINERFDLVNPFSETSPEEAADTEGTSANGHKAIKTEHATKQESTPPSSRQLSSPPPKVEHDSGAENVPPPKKKRKQLTDAELAAKIQAEMNAPTRATRGGNKKVTKKVPRKPRKKSEKKIKNDDDSGLEEVGSDGEVKEKKKGGFHKEYFLSHPLAELVGETKLSRPQVVKKIWEHIRARDLQDPSDKRQILCDEKMQSVFKMDKVHMFTMNKLLGKQLYPVESEE